MSMRLNPALLIDCYKFGHPGQNPEGLTNILTNGTFRTSRVNGVDKVLWFGFQATLNDLTDIWEEQFFGQEESVVLAAYKRRSDGMLGPDAINIDHIRDLHRIGYLPLRVRSLAEGTEVPLRIPVFTIETTDPRFGWLPAYLETWLSAETWLTSTSATTALHLRRALDEWANATSDTPEFVDFQAHDFSYRGMTSTESAMKSAAGHLLSFAGTDTVPGLDWIEWHYGNPGLKSVLGVSVPATEHSVMCAGGEETEAETFARLLKLYPAGIVSVVSDTWDLWKVITEILPSLKEEILARDGKLVIRPDSGDPVDILTGTYKPQWTGTDGYHEDARPRAPYEVTQPEHKGVIELLWEVFGGTVNSKGYKVLDSHIGAIYGDSITYDRANEICRRLEAKGFASTNVVFGVGSFTYQYVTRDTFGFAMKATWAEIKGEGRNLFKDPITDSGIKRSARGRLAVIKIADEYTLIEEASPEIEDSEDNELKVIWEDGGYTENGVVNWPTLVERVGVRVLQ